MSLIFKNIALICRQNTIDVAKTLLDLISHLQTKKINVVLEQDTASILQNKKIPTISHNDLRSNCDLIIVIGGDGSILSTSRIAASQNLPIIGINLGRLGFLSDIIPNSVVKIDEILAGKFYEEQRFLLTAEMKNKNHETIKNIALNDIVFISCTAGRIINFSVYVDQQFLCTYHADGLIIATPTGSTAHALSGGGPILHPSLDAVVLVPMLSHNLSSRPIVIKNESSIKLIFNNTNISDVLVRCDGQIQEVPHGGTVKIKKAQEKLRLLHPIDYNYFETLRTKLHWETK